MAHTVHIYDTTLRDGTQAEGVSFSVEDKLKICERLDAFGVHFIEGGYPASNPKDAEFFQRALDLDLKNARLTAFGMTRRANVPVEEDQTMQVLAECGVSVVTIVGTKAGRYSVK